MECELGDFALTDGFYLSNLFNKSIVNIVL